MLRRGSSPYCSCGKAPGNQEETHFSGAMNTYGLLYSSRVDAPRHLYGRCRGTVGGPHHNNGIWLHRRLIPPAVDAHQLAWPKRAWSPSFFLGVLRIWRDPWHVRLLGRERVPAAVLRSQPPAKFLQVLRPVFLESVCRLHVHALGLLRAIWPSFHGLCVVLPQCSLPKYNTHWYVNANVPVTVTARVVYS